jgi:hypothetical protein
MPQNPSLVTQQVTELTDKAVGLKGVSKELQTSRKEMKLYQYSGKSNY